jgi:DNA-binding MarR family transcriptional regulator
MTGRHGLAIDELARSVDAFRDTLAGLRPALIADTEATSAESLARRLYDLRRRRETLFPNSAELFGEPAWDAMLDLFIAHEAGREISMADAAQGACTSTTAAQRWIGVLEARGLAERYADPHDRRRTLVRLTGAATDAMRRYLDDL